MNIIGHDLDAAVESLDLDVNGNYKIKDMFDDDELGEMFQKIHSLVPKDKKSEAFDLIIDISVQMSVLDMTKDQ